MTRQKRLAREQNGNLETAIALLLREQAESVVENRELNREILALRKATDERLGRMEALLIQHNRILKDLPEAIRQKIGFQK
jgi:hypothetical protein